jgi:hypothetical protein
MLSKQITKNPQIGIKPDISSPFCFHGSEAPINTKMATNTASFRKDGSFTEYGLFSSGNGGSSFYLIHAKNPIKKA